MSQWQLTEITRPHRLLERPLSLLSSAPSTCTFLSTGPRNRFLFLTLSRVLFEVVRFFSLLSSVLKIIFPLQAAVRQPRSISDVTCSSCVVRKDGQHEAPLFPADCRAWNEIKALTLSWFVGLALVLSQMEALRRWLQGLRDAYIAMIL